MTTVTSFAEQRIQQINQRIMSFTGLLDIIQRFGLYPELVDKKTTEEIVEQMRKDTELKPVSADVMDRRTGKPTAATIAFTFGTKIKVSGKIYEVQDRMHGRYGCDYFDIYMHDYSRAVRFGIQPLKYEVI